ncbi:hypothetical protein [Iamia sp.]|uniref:hypothetical protein n=1 Tax=Iamia sp. TaxID=2722710 RepID=UPI002C3FEECA|nr:hypothetical protein [Iamia sp.]HXH57828.1 hypothetical protein [Iamia sp.]
MSLSEKSRSSLYLGLGAVIRDEEAISEMLAHFPARDLDEAATKDHMRAEFALFGRQMADGFADAARERAALEQRMTDGFAHAAAERAALETRLLDAVAASAGEMRRWFLGLMVLMVTLAGVVVALIGVVSAPG